MSKGWQIALGVLACAILLGWYSTSALEDDASFTYYQTLDEFRAAHAVPASRSVPARVHGYVADGSIDRDVAAKAVRFTMQAEPPHSGVAAGTRLRVEYASLEVPDLFKDGAEVVVEGRLVESDGAAVFRATNVLAKCPSKFEAAGPETTPL